MRTSSSSFLAVTSQWCHPLYLFKITTRPFANSFAAVYLGEANHHWQQSCPELQRVTWSFVLYYCSHLDKVVVETSKNTNVKISCMHMESAFYIYITAMSHVHVLYVCVCCRDPRGFAFISALIDPSWRKCIVLNIDPQVILLLQFFLETVVSTWMS